jgi:hypothetical protein
VSEAQEDGESALPRPPFYGDEDCLVVPVDPSEPAGPQSPARCLRSRDTPIRGIEDDRLAESLIRRHSIRIA